MVTETTNRMEDFGTEIIAGDKTRFCPVLTGLPCRVPKAFLANITTASECTISGRAAVAGKERDTFDDTKPHRVLLSW